MIEIDTTKFSGINANPNIAILIYPECGVMFSEILIKRIKINDLSDLSKFFCINHAPTFLGW